MLTVGFIMMTIYAVRDELLPSMICILLGDLFLMIVIVLLVCELHINYVMEVSFAVYFDLFYFMHVVLHTCQSVIIWVVYFTIALSCYTSALHETQK